MATRLARVCARREALLLRIAGQRQDLAMQYDQLEKQMRWPEMAFRFGLSLHQQPWVAGVITIGSALIGPRLGVWPSRINSILSGAKIASAWWQRLRG
jgi:hypothetical protein